MKMMTFALLVACGGAQASQPTPAPSASTEPAPAIAPAADDPIAQAALAEQYDLGKRVYKSKKCDTCHGERGEGTTKSPRLIGEGALPEVAPATAKLRKGVAFKTAKDVLDFVKTAMPMSKPGETQVKLTDDDATAVVAWMLSESKVNIRRKLDPANAATVPLR